MLEGRLSLVQVGKGVGEHLDIRKSVDLGGIHPQVLRVLVHTIAEATIMLLMITFERLWRGACRLKKSNVTPVSKRKEREPRKSLAGYHTLER